MIKQHAIDRANENFKNSQSERLPVAGENRKEAAHGAQGLLDKQFEKKTAQEDLMRRRQQTKDERAQKLAAKQARLDTANADHGQTGAQWKERNARLIDNAAKIANAQAEAADGGVEAGGAGAGAGATVTTTAASGDTPDGYDL